jgi:hypothetical protein
MDNKKLARDYRGKTVPASALKSGSPGHGAETAFLP